MKRTLALLISTIGLAATLYGGQIIRVGSPVPFQSRSFRPAYFQSHAPQFYGGFYDRRDYGYPYRGYQGFERSYGYGYGFPYRNPSYPVYSFPSCTVSPFGRFGSGYLRPDPGYPLGRAAYTVVLSPGGGGEVVRANFSDVIFNVTPSTALVYLDGKLIGSARSFASERDRYTIIDGSHHLKIEYPGYETFEAEMEIIPNRTLQIDVELERPAIR